MGQPGTWGRARTRWPARRILTRRGLLLATALLVALYVDAVRNNPLETTRRRGNSIVDALERFHADRGHYPDRLSALAPAYLARIEPPAWGSRRWEYSVKHATVRAIYAATDSARANGPTADSVVTFVDLGVRGDSLGLCVYHRLSIWGDHWPLPSC